MTTNIQKRIEELEAEADQLKMKHEETVKQFQQIVQQNQTRYAFLQGSIAELRKQNEGNNGESTNIPDLPPRRTRGRPRRIPDVVN